MSGILVSLPDAVQMTCGLCRERFSLAARQLSGRTRLVCPFCGLPMDVYEALDPKIRRQLYHAVRDAIEHRVYEEQQMDSEEYFEDSANLHPEH